MSNHSRITCAIALPVALGVAPLQAAGPPELLTEAEGVFMEYKPSEPALLIEPMRTLGAMDPADWAETTLGYEVKK